jgi:ABC-type branched-subunit amino acid transport system substrate-binding protein
MMRTMKRAAVALLALVLAVMLLPGCGGGGGAKTTITIGEMTDLTGPASPALIPLHYAVEDLVRYYNEEGLISGVKLRLATWDTQWNPARDIPGYDWLREQGAKLIITVPSTTALTLKSFLERDRVVVASLTTTPAVCEPPGWAFCFSNSDYDNTKTLLKWVSEHDWDYAQGIPKLGMVGEVDPSLQEVDEALKEYVQDHPGQFEYVGSFMAPIGTTLFSGAVEKLKDCDFVCVTSMDAPRFITQYEGAGYHARFINVGGGATVRGFWADLYGWETLNGLLTTSSSLCWDQSTPVVDLAQKLVHEFHPGKAEDIIYSGGAYPGGYQETIPILDIVKAAIQKVGAENIDGQAFYDAAVEYKTEGSMWEGYPQWSFSETKRYLVDDIVLYQFSAEKKDLVKVTDWLPLVVE